jgi:hypothetical protein
MPYEKKDGEFTLAKNERKAQASQADYLGAGTSLDGTPIWVDCWLRKSKDGRSFLSCRMKAKEANNGKPARAKSDLNDPIGF